MFLKPIYETLEQIQDLKELAKTGKVPPVVCAKVVTTIQLVYQCQDCKIHPDSMWCEECFENGEHDGHRVMTSMASGVCDCGDSASVKPEGFCKNHQGIQSLQMGAMGILD